MYRDHWNLRLRPFEDNFDSRFLYPVAAFQAAELKLRYVIENRLGAALLTGVAGSGKTFLTEVLASSLPDSAGPIIRVGCPQFSSRELLRYLAMELATDADASFIPNEIGLDQLTHDVSRLLLEHANAKRQPILIIERADQIESESIFQTLRQLLEEHAECGRILTLFLLGEPVLVPRIQRYSSLAERIAVSCFLPAMNAQETKDYISHRLQVAGTVTELFEPDAVQTVFELSAGLPLRINHLCELALLVGFADRSTTISASHVQSVAKELIPLAA